MTTACTLLLTGDWAEGLESVKSLAKSGCQGASTTDGQGDRTNMNDSCLRPVDTLISRGIVGVLFAIVWFFFVAVASSSPQSLFNQLRLIIVRTVLGGNRRPQCVGGRERSLVVKGD